MDSVRIEHNIGERRNSRARNMLQVVFDVLAGDPVRARPWRGSGYDTFEQQDFVSPMMSSFAPEKSSVGFGVSSEVKSISKILFHDKTMKLQFVRQKQALYQLKKSSW